MGNCISPNSLAIRTREHERTAILEALESQLDDSLVFYVISLKWFISWKQYSGFELDPSSIENSGSQSRRGSSDGSAADDSDTMDSVGEMDTPPPGPINNTDLLSPTCDVELRKGLIEDYDYELLPAHVYKLLEGWYHGGPPIARLLIEQSEGHFSVELYPHRFDMMRCGATGKVDPRSLKTTTFSRETTVDEVEEKVCSVYRVSPSSSRIWIKVCSDDDQGGSDVSIKDDTGRGDERLSTQESNTEEYDEDSDEWRLLKTNHESDDTKLGEILEDCDYLKVMLEVAVNGLYPRDSGNDDWRNRLGVDDKVDALDSDQRWFESVITDVDGDSVKVHFMGWNSKWDTWMRRTDATLDRLHTHTAAWRDLKKGDVLEVSNKAYTGSTNAQNNHWFHAQVLKVEKMPQGGKKALLSASPGETWVDMESELICLTGTHTRLRNRKNQSSSSSSSSNKITRSIDRNLGSWGYRSHVSGSPLATGSVGLTNLGNTCFMNSMLQCMSQTSSLTDFFLEAKHRKDINKTNPLGTGGKLAEAYVDLVGKIWSGNFTTVVPKEFKQTLGKFAPQFAGYQQHDSQEFMSFLMDGIHEDLNRVRKKPCTAVVEGGGGKPDEKVAAEAWRRHLMRNDSVVVDRCQGLLRSHLTCPSCQHESITFDPYMCLSLPLPSNNSTNSSTRKILVTVVPQPPGSPGTELQVVVPLNGTINQVRAAVCDALSDVKASNLHICDIWSNRIHKTWKWSESLVDIRPTDITYVYELEHTITRASSARTADVLFSRRVKNDRQGNQSPSFQSFAVPWRFSYTTSTCRQARAMIVAHCSSLVKEEERSRFSCDDTGTFFRVVESNSQGTDLTYDLPNNDSVFSLSKGRALTLIWTRAGCLLLKDQDPPNRRERRTAENGQSADRSSVDLLDCFKLYVERERLGKDDTWYCPKCKHHVEAYKKIDLWTVPDVLIIHLKRFQYTPGTYFIHRQKIDALVNFPLDCLDLSEVIVGPKDAPVYELYAVSEHIGGMGGGHYTAVVKNMRNARWYSFNDTQVSETQAEATLTPQAYVLFYRRKDRGMRWGGIRLPSETKGSKRAP